MGVIYTIGHGNKSFEEFLLELNSLGIKYLIDIRSKPYSKWSTHFNQEPLKALLQRNGITYVYMGDVLGGLPNDPTCYTNGKVDYSKVAQKDFFIAGINRLIKASQSDIPISIMCSEADPKMCHRYKLIGKVLTDNHIPVLHRVNNVSKSQADLDIEATGGWGTMDLFGVAPTASRKTYLIPTEQSSFSHFD